MQALTAHPDTVSASSRQYTPSRVVVTGAAGFIGGHVARRLIAEGMEVCGVDRRDPEHDLVAGRNLSDVLGKSGFTFQCFDLTDRGWESVLRGTDTVVHLAALPGVRPSWGAQFDAYANCNVIATQRVMDASVTARIPRVVVASSSSVYGRTDGHPSSETAPTRPLSPYGVTKLATEAIALAHAQRHDSATSVASLRYFTVYGPRQRDDMLIGRALSAALGGAPLTLYGNGEQSRDFTYIDDVVEATLAAARSQVSGAVNVGAGTATSVCEVLRVAEQLTGCRVPTKPASAADGDAPATLADATRAHRVLAWCPRVDLVTGMRRQLAWLQTQPVAPASATA
ncbi:NAD-dependent epimerase/dehydratase family protein [Actinopolyspora halophila]|uniref:NAD-dependent epimerase/dehydratase family protein n=1 Tax=Actinopolyspora halophila TaxID=1850 RepID=UPI0003683B28|nr:NAD-dependent epimerase/dehydratase family protein [Actinopolyspora halophila]